MLEYSKYIYKYSQKSMRLHRFFVNENNNKNKKLPLGEEVVELYNEETIHQIKNVLRLKIGDTVCLFNEKNNQKDIGYQYLYSIKEINKKSCILSFISKETVNVMHCKFEIILCMSLIKSNFEDIVRQSVEIGVNKIVPIISERSERKEINIERLQKISIEASEQSGRIDTVKIEKPCKINTFFDNLSKQELGKKYENIIYHTKNFKLSVEKLDLNLGLLNKDSVNNNESLIIYVWVGPEGGWTDAEIEYFKANRSHFKYLNTYILKASTAGPLAIFDTIKNIKNI